MALITFVPVIFIVLSLHEYGHYASARLFGMDVTEFKLGLGKEFYSKEINKTLFSFHLIPISAHVYINDQQFNEAPLFKKLIIILAGPFVNFLLSLIVIFLFLFMVGQPSSPPVFAGIEINSPADKAGLETNDKIIKIDNIFVTRYEEILEITKSTPVKKLSLTIERDKENKVIEITPELATYINNKGIEKSHGRMGVLARHSPYNFKIIKEINGQRIIDKDFNAIKKILTAHLNKDIVIGLESVDKTTHNYRTYLSNDLNKNYFINDDIDRFVLGHIGRNFYQNMTFTNAAGAAYNHTLEIIKTILHIPQQIFPIDTENFSPQTIVDYGGFNIIGKTYKFCFMIAFVSIVVGFINLLPIGYLDGGRIMVLLVEKISKRNLTRKNIASISFAILMSAYLFMIVINYPKFSIYINHIYSEAVELLEN